MSSFTIRGEDSLFATGERSSATSAGPDDSLIVAAPGLLTLSLTAAESGNSLIVAAPGLLTLSLTAAESGNSLIVAAPGLPTFSPTAGNSLIVPTLGLPATLAASTATGVGGRILLAVMPLGLLGLGGSGFFREAGLGDGELVGD
jgi:hypothetical protein